MSELEAVDRQGENTEDDPMDLDPPSAPPECEPNNLGDPALYDPDSDEEMESAAPSKPQLTQREALNLFLQVSGSDAKLSYTTTKKYEDLHRSKQHKIRTVAGKSITALLHTISSNRHDDSNLWKVVKESCCVDDRYLDTLIHCQVFIQWPVPGRFQ